MSWTFDEVMSVLGDRVQATASGPVVVVEQPGETPDAPVRLKHVLVGTFVGHSFVVTEEGLRLLDKNVAVDAEVVSERKKPASRKKKEEPVAAPEPDLDDLDLAD